MTLLFRDGFNDGTFGAFSGVVTDLGGSIAIVSENPPEGPYCAKCSIVGAGIEAPGAYERAYVWVNLPSSLPKLYAQYKVRFQALPDLYDRRITILTMAVIGNYSPVGSCGVLNVGGKVRWYLVKATRVYNPDIVVEPNRLYTVELMQDDFLEGLVLYVDGVEVLRLPEISSTNLGAVRFGSTASTASNPLTLDIDDCIVADTYIGIEPPPPSYTLTITSTPVSVPFMVSDLEYSTPFQAILETGMYETVMPSTVTVGADIYNFAQWGDGVTSPSRTVNLDQDVSLIAIYELQPPEAVTLNYSSYPIPVNATVDGYTVQSGGSLQVAKGSVVTVKVPLEVEI